MKTKKIQKLLGWCIVLNFGLMLVSVLAIYVAHDWMYDIHQTFFKVSAETYDALLFGYMGFWKALTIVLVVIPYIAIRIVNKNDIQQ